MAWPGERIAWIGALVLVVSPGCLTLDTPAEPLLPTRYQTRAGPYLAYAKGRYI